ncbi:MAG: squalene--hopene cyclase [Nitrospinales bacterium]
MDNTIIPDTPESPSANPPQEPVSGPNQAMNDSLNITSRLEEAIRKSSDYLLSQQDEEGFWVAELEANATVTAELVMIMRMMGVDDPAKRQKCANYLFHYQQEDGSWPMFYGAEGNVSVTVEAYMALKMAGIPADRPEMAKAREFIFSHGGIRSTRIFTKMFLALFGQIPWDDLPSMPVEINLLPNWFYFNIYELSSWSRSTIVPLTIVFSRRPVYKLDEAEGAQEIFMESDRDLAIKCMWDGPWFTWHNFFILLDHGIKFLGKSPWKPFRKKAFKKAEDWIIEHQEPEGDWGGIQPPMVYSLLALKEQGYGSDHPAIVKGWESIDRFSIYRDDRLVMQACVSPLWDTAITCNALLDAGLPPDHPAFVKAAEWILKRQVVSYGDWKIKNPHAQPGGWAFEFFNQFYPDTDDSAEILVSLHRTQVPDFRWKLKECERALAWLLSMQCKNGGWGAFDIDNDKEIFNEIPFSDQKALLDPPTVDVTSRILWMLAKLGFTQEHHRVKRAVEFVKSEQEEDGCWFGRWGVNYIYGTFLALQGLREIGENPDQAYIKKAVQWLKDHQNEDGGWGETCQSYEEPYLRGQGNSTASQTAWALMGLMAAGEVECPAVEKGIRFLLDGQNKEGTWWEDEFTGTGFPGHFFLKYHMYKHNFPLSALSRFRKIRP